MKNPKTSQPPHQRLMFNPVMQAPSKTTVLLIAALVTACLLTGSLTQAANLLDNGDFNLPNSTAAPTSWTPWSYGGGWANHQNDSSSFDGTYYMAVGGSSGSSSSGGGVYQIVPSALPGVTYTLTVESGAQAWWRPYAEMRLIFLNATNGIVLQTNSATVFPTAYDAPWPWTNYTLVAIAPAGATQVKVEFANQSGTGTAWFDDAVLTASVVYPAITNVYPNGVTLMQNTNALTFTASSTTTAINTNGIQVTLNGVDVSSSLAITGSAMSKSVTYTGLKSNQLYTATIVVADANNVSSTKTVSFDTYSATYLWEAEDFDFNGGQYINNPVLSSGPQANSYFGVVGTQGVDENETDNGGTGDGDMLFRPQDPMATGLANDTPRQNFLDAQVLDPSIADYDVGWFNPGEWVNYTRNFPAGKYNIYARLANGNGGVATINLDRVVSGQTTTSQITAPLGTFKFTARGWSTYDFVPLTDTYNNLVAVDLNGVTTLRATAGGANMNFFMLVPAMLNLPAITNLYPDGLILFQATNKLVFTAVSPNTTIPTNGIQVTLNGVDVSSSLIITGSSTNKSVVYAGLRTNTPYTASIKITDANGSVASTTFKFDTFIPSFVWEGEDWDYSGGQFINNPILSSTAQANSYFGTVGTQGVDENETGGSPPGSGDGGAGDHAYRPDPMAAVVSTDVPRQNFLNAHALDPNIQDYACGFFTAGEWVNYTRTFPAGTYNIYARLANGNGGTAAVYLSQVTVNPGTANQGTVDLGSFVFPAQAWTTYDYVPLQDRFGNLAAVTLNGTTTLRITGGGANMNFFLLVPARTDLPSITQVYPDGTTLLQGTNKLSFVAGNPTIPIYTSNIVVSLNGVDVSAQLAFSGSANNWNVSVPIAANIPSYTAVLRVTDAASNFVTTTLYFDTYNPANFVWEAEDFDFNGGEFIDTPVPTSGPAANSYFGQVSIPGVDEDYVTFPSGDPLLYRSGDYISTDVCTDTPLNKYVLARLTDPSILDYNIAYWVSNSWINYTRTYPAGTFNVYGRLASGSGTTYNLELDRVSAGATNYLGTFTRLGRGWPYFDWVPLVNTNNGQLATVTLGGVATLRTITDGNVNPNRYMLAPAMALPSAVSLSASRSGANVVLSFPTQSGYSYNLYYKNDFSDASWTFLTTVVGDGSAKSVSQPANASKRLYRLVIQ